MEKVASDISNSHKCEEGELGHEIKTLQKISECHNYIDIVRLTKCANYPL